MSTTLPDLLTPEQAASYLQVNRETIYRYIRSGKLSDSRLGRDYRIPRTSIDQLLFDTRARSDITIREYPDEQIAAFLDADRPNEEALAVIRRYHPNASPKK